MKNWSYTITDKEHPHYGETLWSGRYCTCTAFVYMVDRKDKVFILANKRGPGTPDYQGYWNCPCGYIEADEDLYDACTRETLEETGYLIFPNKFELYKVETDPRKCNNGNISMHCVAILSPTEITKQVQLSGEKDEVSAVKWIPVDQIDSYLWAFNHNNVIQDIIKYYKSVIQWKSLKEKLSPTNQ